MKSRVSIGLAVIFLFSLAIDGYPQSFPTKPVMLMVAYPAGGSTDVGARIVAAIAEKDLGQAIVVLNKPGAGGQVGWTELGRQKPDGYYIGFVNLPIINTVILDPDRKAVFDIDAFAPIINHVLDPGIVYVRPDSPYKTLKDLIDEAKKRPGELRAGTTGILGDDHMAILMLEEAAGIKLRIVHFDGDSPQATALMGQQIEISFLNVGGMTSRVKSGQMKPLVVMDKERSKFYPDVPTTAELGYPTVLSASTRGIAGPKGIPPAIAQKLQTVLKKAMGDPEHVKKMDAAGLAIKVMIGEEYLNYWKAVHEKAKVLVDEARKAR